VLCMVQMGAKPDNKCHPTTSFQWLVFVSLAFNHAFSPSARTAIPVWSSCLLYNRVRVHITGPKWTWCMHSNFHALLLVTLFIATENRKNLEHLNFCPRWSNLHGIRAPDVCFFLYIGVIYIYSIFCRQSNSVCLLAESWWTEVVPNAMFTA